MSTGSKLHITKHLLDPRKGLRQLALFWMLVFALSWQGFVVQTHRHSALASVTAAKQAVPKAPAGQKRQLPLDSPANCSVCRAVASAGPALLPTAVTIEAPIALPETSLARAPDMVVAARRTHLWRSRAPPYPLPA